MRLKRLPRLMSALITALAVMTVTLELPNLAMAQEEAPTVLHIVIEDGEGAVNNVRQRVAREPIVRIEDQNRRPIAGATVVFLLPSDGASGTFPGGQKMVTLQTDSAGRAAARGLQPNSVTGDFTIRVTASHRGVTATAVINQTNAIAGAAAGAAAGGAAAATAGMSAAKIVGIIAIVGAAAVAGGTYAATRNGNDSPSGPAPRPTTSVSVGSPSVGAP
jgi:hypothetical protein